MFLYTKNNIKLLLTSISLFFTNLCAFSQPTITGPTCVVPGTVYHYRISGSWKASSTMQVCISGGTLKSKDTSLHNCTPLGGAPLSSVLVIWNSSGPASLRVTSGLGNSSLNIVITAPLTPGSIDSASKIQAIVYDSIPTAIACSSESGGSCSPNYIDQWQQSLDMVAWVDIPGATSRNLSTIPRLTQSTFFRRKVTEKSSGTVAYSDVAFVDVGPPAPPSHAYYRLKGKEYWITAYVTKDINIKTF
jgi:hypothetical protein